MIRLTLQRIYLTEKYTIGKLSIQDQYFSDTLEDPVRDMPKEAKIYGNTAIPYGIYRVRVTDSPKFKRRMPLLLYVPNFEGIRIHAGNNTADTLGCILVGENKVKGGLINSRMHEDLLTKRLEGYQAQGEEIYIHII